MRPRRWVRRYAVLVTATLLAAGGGVVAAAVLIAQPGPAPGTLPVRAETRGLARSEPVRMVIPRLGVDAQIRPLTRDSAGRLAMPARAAVAGWYAGGTSPGEPGSAVIMGHAGEFRGGPAVFARLDRLVPGDQITVYRADRTVARFTVDRTVPYSPAERGYSPAGHVSLRLVPVYRNGPPAGPAGRPPAVGVGAAPLPQPVVIAVLAP